MKKLIIVLLASPLLFVACKHNDPRPLPMKDFTLTIENIATPKMYIGSGVFNTPDGDASPGPATPGKMYKFMVTAGRSQHLSFATMLAATNDLFFAPDGNGIALYESDGSAISGNVTDQVYLWDAGTEINEEPGVGPNTVGKQGGANTGPDENGNVVMIQDATNGVSFTYPDVADLIKVSVTHMGGSEFMISIEDIATASLSTSMGDIAAPLSPGVWVVNNGIDPLFTEGMPDRGMGLESIAEDGNPSFLGTYLADNTGVTFPASPGVWTVHTSESNPMYHDGMQDYGMGLEAIAEDGNPSMLGGNLSSADGFISGDVFNTPMGSSTPGPLLPGSKYQFTFSASPGDNISFVTMLAATNDVFFGPEDMGIELYYRNDHEKISAISGDITDMIHLWDAGTEINEQPAIGPNTVTNQTGTDTGMDENGPVQMLNMVNDGFTYPAVNEVLKVTIRYN